MTSGLGAYEIKIDNIHIISIIFSFTFHSIDPRCHPYIGYMLVYVLANLSSSSLIKINVKKNTST
jgi:hypothetical protein